MYIYTTVHKVYIFFLVNNAICLLLAVDRKIFKYNLASPFQPFGRNRNCKCKKLESC